MTLDETFWKKQNPDSPFQKTKRAHRLVHPINDSKYIRDFGLKQEVKLGKNEEYIQKIKNPATKRGFYKPRP